MVRVIVGDLFASSAQTLVNTVNCVGVMGKGIALEFKKRFPEMFNDYVVRCEHQEVKLGRPYLWRLSSPWVLNFPTKGHWRSVTKLSDLERGLEFLIAHYEDWGIESLAVPPLGCGNGQLEWRIVGPTLYRYLSRLEIPVELYAPYGTSHDELHPEFLDGASRQLRLTEFIPEPEWVPTEWVVIAEILGRIFDEPYHRPIGRTIFQKLAYVATHEGLPTGLEFERKGHGPFARGLVRLESRLVNNGLIRVDESGRMQRVTAGPTLESARHAYRDDIAEWEPLIDRLVDLFLRLDTTYAEIVASSIFVAHELVESGHEPTERLVLDAVMEWKQHRRTPLDEEAVATTIRTLSQRRWLQVQSSSDLPLPDEALLYA